MTTPLTELAELITTHAAEPLPAPVREAARRTLYNVLATSIGASGEPAVTVAVSALRELGGAPGDGGGAAPVLGRAERLAAGDAALVTGIAAHLDDYDDTHLGTVIHPGAVGLAALVGLSGEFGAADADRVLSAYAWGVEAQLRLGVAVSPEHYDAGWHITGTVGAVGAAVTSALLLRLSPARLAVALEWAVESAVGQREGFGSMTKPFHPGAAAAAGLRAARDAAAGLPGPGDSLTGPDGFVARLAAGKFDAPALLGAPGQRWELMANTFKPYPCGIVSHPAIEAAEALAARVHDHGGADAVTAISLDCHPLVPELTGNQQPVDGLQARFSTAHGIVAGLLAPPVDLSGYRTELVGSQPARRLRALVRFRARADCPRDSAGLEVTMADGTVPRHRVEHARGSLARPLTEAELAAKALRLIDPVLGPGAAERLDAATRAAGPGYLRDVLAACSPGPAAGAGALPVPGPEPTDSTLDHRIARRLAEPEPVTVDGSIDRAVALARRAADARLPESTDRRRVAAAIGAELVAAGTPAALAAAAASVWHRPDAESAVATALDIAEELAGRLAVPVDRLVGLAATLAAAHRATPARALAALGLATTRTTGVIGPAAGTEVVAARVDRAIGAALESVALATAGFTTAAHPLTGRRGLLALAGLRTG